MFEVQSLNMERIALVGPVGLAVLILHVDLQVLEVARLLQFPQFGLRVFEAMKLLGRGNVVGKLQFLLLGVENGDPLILRAVSDNEFLAHIGLF